MFKSTIVCSIVLMTIVCTVNSDNALGKGGCSLRYGPQGICWRYCSGSSGVWCYTGISCKDKTCNESQKCIGIACPASKKNCVLNCPSDCNDVSYVVACEGSPVDLECSVSNTTIKVVSANYGRTQKGAVICDNSKILSTNCQATNSTETVADRCDGKSDCTVEAINGIFGDPCRGTFKYLEVQYNCV